MSENVFIFRLGLNKSTASTCYRRSWLGCQKPYILGNMHPENSPVDSSGVLNKLGFFRPKQIPWPVCGQNARELLWQNPVLVPTFYVPAFLHINQRLAVINRTIR